MLCRMRCEAKTGLQQAPGFFVNKLPSHPFRVEASQGTHRTEVHIIIEQPVTCPLAFVVDFRLVMVA